MSEQKDEYEGRPKDVNEGSQNDVNEGSPSRVNDSLNYLRTLWKRNTCDIINCRRRFNTITMLIYNIIITLI